MSREFGSYHAPGYFHVKLENAAEDACGGDWPLTKLMEAPLTELSKAAYVCSSIEACDWSDTPKHVDEWLDAMVAARDAIERALLKAHVHMAKEPK